ncbi:hypothetical protein CHLNCDRAFT_136123 [Chlorella variabilis]|uniref:Peptidase C1A papain C-terminal domain-containing protein n=1 Tax=Chlorella variabilis TaxID=554065 RepID=E1ZJT3_CHLVA|nr:hypothetical protein CHLNCDRAFT_136123 [Chlorella variabilis]EFN54048.1 hypothetical protein CHLNCDRAFT_136123 [Chlorella variabilis]|eukprot:XP_005846150.1 hypothetical protein CHLNCDRAFT_136123 [Chlorella variabilis]
MLLLFGSATAARLPVDGSAAAAASLRPGAAREAPRFPESYSVNYTFTLPYTARVQQPAISYPVAFWRDAKAGRVRMDTYGSTQGKTFELVPRIDRLVCLKFGDEEGEEGRMSALPDITGWQFGGTEELNGEDADVWRYEARHEAKHVVYKFYAAADGTPHRLHMHGNDMISGSHFDEWVVDYSHYEAGRPHPDLFRTPDLCKREEAAAAGGRGRAGAQMRWAAMVPAVRYRGDAQYDVFLAGHGAARSHASLPDYQRRRELFHASRRLIEAHNARRDRQYTLEMNRFGDYSEEEFVALMLPKKAARQQRLLREGGAGGGARAEAVGATAEERGKLARHQLPYEARADATRLPASLTWRGTGADSVGVKDQATCGSCWSFAATGAMEGAWWLSTGQAVSLSEQQILDCSWGYRPERPEANLACDGGDPDAGGGFARVPRCDDGALMEALYSRGPLAISFDASRPSFRFFSSGVYVDTECAWKPDELDHSMVLVGYGTNEAGDYWEVKNSWSTHWGEKGYFKVSRTVNHACGVPADAYYAVVADDV